VQCIRHAYTQHINTPAPARADGLDELEVDDETLLARQLNGLLCEQCKMVIRHHTNAHATHTHITTCSGALPNAFNIVRRASSYEAHT
jgi:hypothetical protein